MEARSRCPLVRDQLDRLALVAGLREQFAGMGDIVGVALVLRRAVVQAADQGATESFALASALETASAICLAVEGCQIASRIRSPLARDRCSATGSRALSPVVVLSLYSSLVAFEIFDFRSPSRTVDMSTPPEQYRPWWRNGIGDHLEFGPCPPRGFSRRLAIARLAGEANRRTCSARRFAALPLVQLERPGADRLHAAAVGTSESLCSMPVMPQSGRPAYPSNSAVGRSSADHDGLWIRRLHRFDFGARCGRNSDRQRHSVSGSSHRFQLHPGHPPP